MSPLQSIVITVNGTRYERAVEPRMLLVDLLRDGLGLTGTHVGCETSQCGCCVVLLNGQACKACTLLAVQADRGEVTTIEGLAQDGRLHPVQEAFRRKHGLQCGFCTPGMVMVAVDLSTREPNPSEAEIREALHGNMCRCTGYQHIVDAILEAAIRMSQPTGQVAHGGGQGGSPSEPSS
jgi:aerobic carbon-monoxide dehydrogenase small subunit